MARQEVGHIAPFINVDFYVTQEWGATTEYGTHKGLDIATSGSKPVYSVSKGTVYYKGYQANGLGHYVIIKNSDDDRGFLYAHLMQESILVLNQNVEIGQFIGNEGSSGNSTGIHLHLEYQVMTGGTWHYSNNLNDYLNPAEFLGVTNVVNYVNPWYYDGIPGPIPPTPTIKRHRFPWFIYQNNGFD